MKKIVGIALTALCLLGCKQEKQELHDPLLRQQLTMMVASLNDQDVSAAEKADDELQAILSVNSAKMSEEQSHKLSAAQMILMKAQIDYEAHDRDNALKPLDQQTDNRLNGIPEAKQLISDAAATF